MAAPNGPSQSEVMVAAGSSLSMWRHSTETHGTGTPLGDAIEVGAILQTFSNERLRTLGAKSSRFGHTEGAAGLVGLLKLLASLQAAYMAPNLHFKTCNPKLGVEGLSTLMPSQTTKHFETSSNQAVPLCFLTMKIESRQSARFEM